MAVNAALLADLIALLRKLLDKEHGYADLDMVEARLTLDSSYWLTQEEVFLVEELMSGGTT